MLISYSEIKDIIRENLKTALMCKGTCSISPSDIHGLGVHAVVDIPKDFCLGPSHIKNPEGGYHITKLGKFHNHSKNPTAYNMLDAGVRRLFTTRNLLPGEEITVDYTKQEDLEQPDFSFV